MKRLFIFLFLAAVVSAQAAELITVAQFIANADTETTYRLRGVVSNITNTTYGNFDLTDETGTILVYGLKTASGASKQFATLGVAEGDTITLDGKYKLYNNKHEVDGGQYVSHVKPSVAWEPVPISISEFIALNDGKRYILTGVVTNIVSEQSGNLYIEDETASIYIYGLKQREDGSALTFSTLGVELGDTLTINGIYQLYGSTPEVTGSRYISHTHPTPIEPEPDPDKVNFATAFAEGWDSWIGKTVTFSNDFVYCDSWNNTIAPHRLRAPEEYGEEGSAAYYEAVAKNTNDSCHLVSPTIDWQTYRVGSIIRGLKAYIPAANQLQAIGSIEIINNELPTVRPDLGNPTIVVCGANIENFFVDHLGSLGAASEEELEIQKAKIGAAFVHIDADIYALCEIEQGTNAVNALIELLGGSSQWGYAVANTSPYNSTMIGFIYRKAKIETYGSVQIPWSTYGASFKYREAIQCFKEKSTGEKFNLSMNHFYAKISKTDADRETNMSDLISKLSTVTSTDPDVLVMGDLNAYTGETAVQMLCTEQGYEDMLMKYDPEGYSHLYGCTAGFLDHAYATPSMAKQVTKAVSYHLNADSPSSLYGYTKGNNSMYRYSDHDPILVGLRLGESVTPVEKYTITFQNYDSTVLEAKQWAYGEVPSCSVTPTRPASGSTTYVFAGWSPTVVAVTADATYTATFTQTTNAFTVEFYDYNWKLLEEQEVNPGEAAVLPKEPKREGYQFDGWKIEEGEGTLDNVQSDMIVRATYTKVEGEGLEDAEVEANVELLYRNGNIYIIRGGEMFTITGQRVY